MRLFFWRSYAWASYAGTPSPPIAAAQTATTRRSVVKGSDRSGYAGSVMSQRDITTGGLADRRLQQLGLTRGDIAAALYGPGSRHEGREFMIKDGVLPDGRRVRLYCQYGREQHVVKFHIVDP